MVPGPPAAPFIPAAGGGWSAYDSLLKDSGADDATRPLQPGEYVSLIGKLAGEQKAQFNQSILIFKELVKELPKVRDSFDESSEVIEARVNLETEKAAKTILIALRKKDVGEALRADLKKQLFYAAVMASDFEKALNIYPKFKAQAGGRMNGILALGAKLRETLLKYDMLEQYFRAIPNSRDGLLQVLLRPELPEGKLSPQQLDLLFHFGSRVPLYYLLSSCTHLKEGVCGNCSGTSETRMRLLIGDSMDGIRPGILQRLCQFASEYA